MKASRPQKIEKKYRNYKETTKVKKVKTNLDQDYFKYLLYASGFFILVELVFLIGTIVTGDKDVLNSYISSGSTETQARLMYNLTTFGQFAIDWALMLLFVFSIMLARRRIEIGNLFIYGWMVFLVVIVVLPFAMSVHNWTIYLKLGILLIPMAVIYYFLLQQANDLRWTRKSDKYEKEGAKYV